MSKNSMGATAQANKPTQTAKPKAAAPTTSVPTEKVAQLAYEKWVRGGCQHGCDQQHWYEAETELRGGK
jgi:hypothetical protein